MLFYHVLDAVLLPLARDTQPRSLKIHIAFQRDMDFLNAFFKFYHSNQCLSLATAIPLCTYVINLCNHAFCYLVFHSNGMFP